MKYKEIKEKFKSIGLGVVKLSDDEWQVYFLTGSQKHHTLAIVYSLESLEKLLNLNL